MVWPCNKIVLDVKQAYERKLGSVKQTYVKLQVSFTANVSCLNLALVFWDDFVVNWSQYSKCRYWTCQQPAALCWRQDFRSEPKNRPISWKKKLSKKYINSVWTKWIRHTALIGALVSGCLFVSSFLSLCWAARKYYSSEKLHVLHWCINTN